MLFPDQSPVKPKLTDEPAATVPFQPTFLVVTGAPTLSGSTASEARLTTPVCPQSSQPTESSSGVQVCVDCCGVPAGRPAASASTAVRMRVLRTVGGLSRGGVQDRGT